MPWASRFVHLHVAKDYHESRITVPEFGVAWEKSSVKMTNVGAPLIDFKLCISRHGDYYVVNYICPILLLVMLTWVGFFMPQAASDRVAYTCTLLLTLMAVNFITADKRPATDEDMWLDEFQTFTLLLVVVATFYTVLLVRAMPADDWPDNKSDARNRLLAKVDHAASIIFPVGSVIQLGYLFWRLNRYRSQGCTAEKDFSGMPAIWTFLVMMIMACVMCSFGIYNFRGSVKSVEDRPTSPPATRGAFIQQAAPPPVALKPGPPMPPVGLRMPTSPPSRTVLPPVVPMSSIAQSRGPPLSPRRGGQGE